jgi:hypothetical protein
MADLEADVCLLNFTKKQGIPILAYLIYHAKSIVCIFTKAWDKICALNNRGVLNLSIIWQQVPFYCPGPLAPSKADMFVPSLSQLGQLVHDISTVEKVGINV